MIKIMHYLRFDKGVSRWRNNTVLSIGLLIASFRIAAGQDNVIRLLKLHQFDATSDGKKFLLSEAKKVNFFLLGELHGEQEIPQLLYSIWPEMNRNGYHHVVAEISPWTAQKLEFGTGADTLQVEALWSNKEARFFRAKSNRIKNPIILGCDMEEISLNLLINDLAQENPYDTMMNKVLLKIKEGYNRRMSPDLLRILSNYRPARDKKYNHTSLFDNIISSLKIDSSRNYTDSRFKAQLLRENLMKDYFLEQYRSLPKVNSGKFLFRFGRNHLHRGYDSRGISTFGNFVSEFAISEGLMSFNVATFAAGGKCELMGETFDADERDDDFAFQYLSEQANYDATIFDLRPLRIYLHALKTEARTELQNRLLFWADSYDAIICFKKVTPLHSK